MLQLEAVQFFQYFEREASCYDRLYFMGDQVIFFHGTDWYSYKWMNRTVVRQMNGDGYITVCYDVDTINFTGNGSGIQARITLSKGKQSWIAETFVANHLTQVGP